MSGINDSRPQDQTGGREKGKHEKSSPFLSFSCLILTANVAVEAANAGLYA